MVCTVVLSAAALASQTHYSYLNEFSAVPLFPPPISATRPCRVRASTLAKKPRKSLYFCDNIPVPSSRSVPSARRAISRAFALYFVFFSTVHRSASRFSSPLGSIARQQGTFTIARWKVPECLLVVVPVPAPPPQRKIIYFETTRIFSSIFTFYAELRVASNLFPPPKSNIGSCVRVYRVIRDTILHSGTLHHC